MQHSLKPIYEDISNDLIPFLKDTGLDKKKCNNYNETIYLNTPLYYLFKHI